MIDPDEREGQVVELLLAWPRDLPGVLIGGYAVAAYGRPRYSDDLDIAIPASAATEWMGWLAKHGLSRERTWKAAVTSEPVPETQRWRDGFVSLDLMSGGVRDRSAGASIPESWLLLRPQALRLELLSGRLDREVPVVRPEGLWATKLLAGRSQDIADLFGISRQPVNIGEVRELFARLQSPRLERKFQATIRSLRERKTYTDALSRLSMGRPSLPPNIRSWDRFTAMVESATRVSRVGQGM